MYTIISCQDTGHNLLVLSPLNASLVHYTAAAFITGTSGALATQLIATFGKKSLSSYCWDSMSDGTAIITFSKLKNPKTYSYRGAISAVRPPDVHFTIHLKELSAVRPPALLTTSKQGYIT